MNWIYVREKYGEMFKDTFGIESEVLDIINLSYEDALKRSENELIEYIKRLENEMRFMGDLAEKDNSKAYLLSKWCFNMVENIDFIITKTQKQE